MAGGYAASDEQRARDRAELDVVVHRLAVNCERLCKEKLLPNGKRAGKYWETSSIDDIKTGKYSLKVDMKTGLWKDYGTVAGQDGAGGTLLQLIAARLTNGNMHEAIEWAKGWLNISSIDPAALEHERAAAARQRAQVDQRESEERESKRRGAAALWHGAVPIVDTPALAYLAGRGIDLKRLGRAPGALRYRPDVWNRESYEACGRQKAKLPAMIASINGLDGQIRGAHRTYLDISGWNHATRSGAVTKDRLLTDAKLSLGPSLGGHIPLWKGEHRAPLRDIPSGTPVYLSEGIEDGLSVAIARSAARVICGVSLSKFAAIELPAQMGPLVIIAQNDPVGSKAADALERAIAAHQQLGRIVQTMWPPAGFKDWNDVLTGKRSDGR